MSLPSSGPLSIGQIAAEENNCGGFSLTYSLRQLSSNATFASPDSMSEFYGYSASPALVSSGLYMHYDWSNSSSYPGSGSALYDLSGNGKTATIYGSPSFVSDGSQSYIFINKSASQYIDTSDSYNFYTSGYTWSMMVYTPDSSYRSALIDMSAPVNPPGSGFEIGTIGGSYNTNGARAFASDNTNQLECNVSNEIYGGYQYFVTAVWNPSTKNITLYRDATQIASVTNSSLGSFYNSRTLKFGVAYDGAVSSYTRQYVVLIYNRALSATEVQTNYQHYACRFLTSGNL